MSGEQAAVNYGAQMFLPCGSDPETAMLFYRWHTEILHTGEFRTGLQYLSHCNLWQGSFDRDQDALAARLVQLPGVPVHDPKAAAKAILDRELKEFGLEEFERIMTLRAENKAKAAAGSKERAL